jgi:uncharacterized protein YodC (DUF2158 family)
MSEEMLRIDGWKYAMIVTPYIKPGSFECFWYNGIGKVVEVKGCLLVPREVDLNGSCYLYRADVGQGETGA